METVIKCLVASLLQIVKNQKRKKIQTWAMSGFVVPSGKVSMNDGGKDKEGPVTWSGPAIVTGSYQESKSRENLAGDAKRRTCFSFT